MIEELFLPYDIVPKIQGEVFAMPYSSEKASFKTRIVLDWHVFSFLLEGEKIVSYASGTQSIAPDRFFFLPSGNCLMSEKIANNGSYRSLLLFVSKKALSSFFMTHATGAVASATTHPLDKSPVTFAKDPYLENFITGLELICAGNLPQNPALHSLKFEELMHYLLNKDQTLLSYFKDLCEEWDEDAQIRKIVNIHLENAVTVEELAFLCNMSLSTFKRKFAKIFGETPKQWFLKMRMKKAAELLKDGSIKAGEIYEQLGYENFSSFVQSFKQVHGMTPKQFQLKN